MRATPQRPLRLRFAAVATALLIGALVPLGTGSASAAQGGTVRVATDLSGQATGALSFDPTRVNVAAAPDTTYQWLVYGSLLKPAGSGKLVPSLARSATVIDPQTIEVKLRDGIAFSDGTRLDASAVKAGIERNLAVPAPHPQFRAELGDIESVEVVDPLTVRLHLSVPAAAAVYPLLAGIETFIVSPTAVTNGTDLNKNPVGAGPFLLKEYAPEQHITLVRNAKYWDAKNVKLSQISFVHVLGGAQTIDALKSDQADVAALTVTDVPSVQGSALTVKPVPVDGSFLWMPLCKSSAPLSDVRVRQALNYAINRNEISKALLAGYGEPVWSLYPKGNQYFVPQLDGYYDYNPKKAKKLLAAAGYKSGVQLTFMPIPGVPLTQQVAEVVQSQWSKVGVDAQIVPTTNFVNDFYVDHRAQVALNPSTRPGILKVAGPYKKGSIGDACDYDDPSLDAIIDRLSTAPDGSPEAVKAWTDAQNFVMKNALSVYIAFIPQFLAWSNHVANVHPIQLSGAITAIPDYTTLTVRSP
jgi:peptide/nickel transport system substrate-binding protein